MTSSSLAPDSPADAHRTARLPGRSFVLMGAYATRIGVQLLLIPILARIIAPEAFGLVALASPIVIFTSILAEAGLVTGLVRSRVSMAAESTAFWFSGGVGLACTLAVAGLAWPVGAVAHQPGLPLVLGALSPALLLTCLTMAPSARLQRTGSFTAFAACELLASVAGAGAALWTALHGWGALSLVSQQLVLAGVRLAANLVLARFRPRAVFDFRQLVPVLATSAPLLGANLLAYLSRSLDNLLIGFVIGPKALGFYATAYQAVQIPEFALGAAVRTAAMPAIAHATDRNAAQGVYLKGLRTISLAAAPLVIYACFNAQPLVRLVLGPAWLPAAALAAVLAPVGLLQALFQLNTAALIGLGALRTQLRLSVLTSVLGLAGIVGGLPWGAWGVAVGYAIGTALAAAPSFYLVLRGLGACWTRLVSGLGRAGFAGAAMILVLALRAHLAPELTGVWELLEAGAVGGAAYVIAMLALELVRPAYLPLRPRRLAMA